MAKKLGRPKLVGLGFHKDLGQYRKVINGRCFYFGPDPTEALARYQLFTETGLVWKRGYRQYCLEADGQNIPLGTTIEIARRNFAAFQARQPIETPSLRFAEFVVNTVSEVGDAYLEWLCRNDKSATHIAQSKQHFEELVELDTCGDVRLEDLTIQYFKAWYNHCRNVVRTGQRQANWHNRRMRSVKAAFSRCRREGWLGVSLGDLDAMLGVLQVHGGQLQEHEVFTPSELRSVLKAAELQDRVAILIGLNCAVGNTDMGRLKWGDIVERQVAGAKVHVFEQARGKTGRKRRTPLWPITEKNLRSWRENCQTRGVSTASSSLVLVTREGTPVANAVTDSNGRLYCHQMLSVRFNSLLTKLGIKRPRLAWYSLRHTAATWATDYAERENLVSEGNEFLLGHASNTMWKTYSRGIPPSLRHAVEAIWRGLNDGEDLELD